MPDLFEPSGSIQGRGFVKLRIDSRDRGQIDNAVPTHGLPDTAGYIDRPEQLRLREHGHRRHTEETSDLIEQAVAQTEVRQHTTDNNS